MSRPIPALACIAFALAGILPAGPSAAQSAGDAARRDIKALLEGVRAPMFGGGKTLAGVTATYSATTAGCTTRIDIALPSHNHSGKDFPARAEQVSVDWSKTQAITTWTSYVLVKAPGLPADGRHFYAGSEAGAARLKASMDTLAGACFGPAANTAPVNVPALSERVFEKPDILGTPQCRFRHVPELVLTDNKPPVVKIANYRVAPAEGGDKDSRFAFSAQSGEQIANWQGILADPQIVLVSDAHRNAGITRAVVTVDGRAIPVPVAPSHEANRYKSIAAGNYVRTVRIHPTSYNPGGLLGAIAAGSTLAVTLYAGNRQVSAWTFDVRTLRHAPAALKGARWTCR